MPIVVYVATLQNGVKCIAPFFLVMMCHYFIMMKTVMVFDTGGTWFIQPICHGDDGLDE